MSAPPPIPSNQHQKDETSVNASFKRISHTAMGNGMGGVTQRTLDIEFQTTPSKAYGSSASKLAAFADKTLPVPSFSSGDSPLSKLPSPTIPASPYSSSASKVAAWAKRAPRKEISSPQPSKKRRLPGLLSEFAKRRDQHKTSAFQPSPQFLDLSEENESELSMSASASSASSTSPTPAGAKSSSDTPAQDAFTPFPIAPKRQVTGKSIHYLLCNELGQEKVLQELSERPRNPMALKTAHLGFSCWYNLDIIAERRSDFGVICDIDDRVFQAYQVIQKAVEDSATPETFCEALYRELELTPEFIGRLLDQDTYQNLDDFKHKYLGRGWLKNQDSYDHIKRLMANEQIIFRMINLLDETGAFPSIKDWLKRNHLHLDTVYTSNIAEWLGNETTRTEMFKNVQKVLEEDTLVVDAQRTSALSGAPELRVTVGHHPKVKYEDPRRQQQRFQNPPGGRMILFS